MANKITKKMLKDYTKIRNEIRLLEEELYQMAHTDAGLGNSVILNYNKGYPRPQSIVGFDKERYKRRAELLEGKRRQCKAVEEFVDSIEDTLTRMVFRKRYIENLKWEEVAGAVGYGSNMDYVRKMVRDKYLAEKKIK